MLASTREMRHVLQTKVAIPFHLEALDVIALLGLKYTLTRVRENEPAIGLHTELNRTVFAFQIVAYFNPVTGIENVRRIERHGTVDM